MRFVIINGINSNFDKSLKENFLDKCGFTEVNGETGGDNDFLCIDTLRNEWCWCEYGFTPFCSFDDMSDYQDRLDKSFSLRDLVKIRY